MSTCGLQRQTVLLALQGSSECLLGLKNSRIHAEKALSVSEMPTSPSMCAAPPARAWSRADPVLCSPYERKVLIDVSTL